MHQVSRDERNLRDHDDSRKRGASAIQQPASFFVNGSLVPSALVAFPLLAVSVSSRHIGTVLIDGRLCVIRARLRKLRNHLELASRVHACTGVIKKLIELHAPGVVVIETERSRPCGSATMTLIHAVVDAAMRHGRVIHASADVASERLVGEPRLLKAAAKLAERYDELHRRLIGPSGEPIRDPLRWRDIRPLVAAYVIAFDAGQRAITSLFAGCRPLSNKDVRSSSH
jgi:hypothetical protein